MRVEGRLVALSTAMLASCALSTPPGHEDVVKQALPEKTSVPPTWKTIADAEPVADEWLKSFGDPTLEAIVAEALANNLDFRQALENITIAQQGLVIVGSQLLPQVGAELGARVTKEATQSANTGTLAFASVGWELDLWGKLRAQRDASQAMYEATALEVAAARQSLAATVAKAWYLATETRQLLSLAEQSVQIYSDLLDLVKIRRSVGKDSDLDIFDTRAKLQYAQSEAEWARAPYGEARRALEVLLGRYPAAEIEVVAEYPRLSPSPAAGVPAALLLRRPDLIAAEREVLAAFRKEEAAELALLPDLSISLSGGRLSDTVLSQFDLNPWLSSAAIGVSIPLYSGGALNAQVKIATAKQAQAVARYGSVLLSAFREVEDTLANEQLLLNREPMAAGALRDRN